MTLLFIDGDACPVKDEAYLVASRYSVPGALLAMGLSYRLGSRQPDPRIGLHD